MQLSIFFFRRFFSGIAFDPFLSTTLRFKVFIYSLMHVKRLGIIKSKAMYK